MTKDALEIIDSIELAKLERRRKWDTRFLSAAKFFAQWSKDPSTQTGAVIATPDDVLIAEGYNGFPPGIADNDRLHDRETKYAIIVHCERNAVLRSRADVRGCTLYTWPFGSCTVCASLMITAGIKRVVFPECPPDKLERWGTDLKRAEALYGEAGVSVNAYPYDPYGK